MSVDRLLGKSSPAIRKYFQTIYYRGLAKVTQVQTSGFSKTKRVETKKLKLLRESGRLKCN